MSTVIWWVCVAFLAGLGVWMVTQGNGPDGAAILGGCLVFVLLWLLLRAVKKRRVSSDT